MKNIFQKALIAGAVLGFSASTFAADVKIGFVDLKKVFDKYYKTVQSSAAIKQEVAEIEKQRKEIIDEGMKRKEEWQKLLDKANDQAVSAQERDRSKKSAEEKLVELKNANDAITEFDKVSQTKVLEKERQRRDSIVAEIRTVLDAKAKAHAYAAVIDVSGESANYAPVILYYSGENDLTDELLKELNAAAPAATSTASGK